MQKSGCSKNGYKYANLSKKQFVAKMVTKYAELNNGQFGAKVAKKKCESQVVTKMATKDTK